MLLSWPTTVTMLDTLKQITLYLLLILNARFFVVTCTEGNTLSLIWVLLALFSIIPLSVSVRYLVEST